MGPQFTSDGRFKGELKVDTITCTDVCAIPVPAPGFALVLFDGQDPQVSLGQATQTFATSTYTKASRIGAASTMDAGRTSNGHSTKGRAAFGATSPGGVITSVSVLVTGLSAGWLFSLAL